MTNPAGILLLQATFWVGWTVVLVSTFLINHFELFGLRQVYARLRGKGLPPPVFKTPFFYKHVRHPIYFGFLLAFWATPRMSYGHLLLAIGVSIYMLIAIRYEERDLTTLYGEEYTRYRSGVGMIVPRFGRRPASSAE